MCFGNLKTTTAFKILNIKFSEANHLPYAIIGNHLLAMQITLKMPQTCLTIHYYYQRCSTASVLGDIVRVIFYLLLQLLPLDVI